MKSTSNLRAVEQIDKQNIVIVIPYRDRVVHYKKIMDHLPSITRKNWTIHTILVEQFDNSPFRRAWLLNIGIAEAKKRFKDDDICVVTHDVDMIADSKVDYGWCDRPTQICSELSCFNGKVPYQASAGGVVQASLKDWYAINGFTNVAIGWGGEDDDLHHRFRINGLLAGNALRRPPKGHGMCHCMHDTDHTKRVRDNKGYSDILSKIKRMKSGSDEWKTDGLNSLKYYVSEEAVDSYGTIHLKVHTSNDYSEDVTVIMKTMNRYRQNNKLIDSIRTYHRVPIIVVDDGHEDVSDKYDNSVTYIKIPFDSGLSRGRNVAVSNVRTKYTLVLDDDFLFTKSVDFPYLKNILEEGVDIVGGTLDDRPSYTAEMEYIDGILNICAGVTTKYNDKCYQTRRILNLFLTRTRFLHEHPWEERRKLQEHTWWFGNLSRTNTKIVYCDNFKLKHQPRLNTHEYTQMRSRYFKFDDDPVQYFCRERCKTPSSGRMASNFNSMVTILNDLRAPWKLYGGSILNWYRDCKLPNDDLDLSIELEWFKENRVLLSNRMKEVGWKMGSKFGNVDTYGYEEAWIRNGLKCDLFSLKNVKNKHISGLTIKGYTHECSYTSNGTVLEKWGDLVIRIPIPVEGVLTQFYGNNWQKPDGKYVWDKTPFLNGRYCAKQF